MLTAGDFRKGITFEINGEPYVVLDFQHVKPGKGAAFVRTKLGKPSTSAITEAPVVLKPEAVSKKAFASPVTELVNR